jgi:hypothetical protein
MSTRSRIGLELSDGSVISSYCHYDGYPEFNGVKLVEHFNSYEKASELIDGGDISCLWTNCGWNNETLPTVGNLYYTSRGDVTEPRLDSCLTQYLNDGEEYAYLFTQCGEWICYDLHGPVPYQVNIPVPVAV